MKDKLKKIREKEILFWKFSEEEKPGANSLRMSLEKISMGKILLDSLDISNINFTSKKRVLEIGAGQGWASCILKKNYPNLHITTTDISSFALESVTDWEKLFDVKVDHKYSCLSEKTKESDNSTDVIFTFASAHHFITHKETIKELSRILKKGGTAVYIFEPVTQKFWYPLAFWRVNRKRPEIREDLLVPSNLKKMAIQEKLDFKIIYTPFFHSRIGFIETFYYLMMSLFPFLQFIFPSTAMILFEKK